VSRLGWSLAVVACCLVAVPLLVHATVLPAYLLPGCGAHAPSSPVAEFDISTGNGTLTVTLAEGRIPADGTHHLDAVVHPAEEFRNDTSYRLLGPDEGADHGDTFTVENVTVAERELQDGDIVRVVWAGYDLDPPPTYCPGHEERSTSRATLAKWTVGEV